MAFVVSLFLPNREPILTKQKQEVHYTQHTHTCSREMERERTGYGTVGQFEGKWTKELGRILEEGDGTAWGRQFYEFSGFLTFSLAFHSCLELEIN